MTGSDVVHRRAYRASHFRVFLVALEQTEGRPDYGHFRSLVTFGPVSVAVSTAWDETAAEQSNVDITVTGYGEPDGQAGDLMPVADGQISVGPKGLQIGDVVEGDYETLQVPVGSYVVTVFADALAPFVARRVRFHLMAL